MRLVFKKLRTPASTIKVSFDGETYITYDVATIKSQGYIEFSESDCPDLTKIKIQGQFATLDSVEVNKNVLIEGNSEGILCNYERPVYNKVHYYCFAYDNDNNGEISDEELPISAHAWLKGEIANNMDMYTTINWTPGIPESADDLTLIKENGYGFISLFAGDDRTKLSYYWLIDGLPIPDNYEPEYSFIRYPAGDLIGYEPTSEIESTSDIIVEIQEEPIITKNGKYYAEDGKAFKSININCKPIYTYTAISIKHGDEVGILYSNIKKDNLEQGDFAFFITYTGKFNPMTISEYDCSIYYFQYKNNITVDEFFQLCQGGYASSAPKEY